MTTTNLANNAVEYANGFRRAILSVCKDCDNRVYFAVRFAGRSKQFKTREGAETYAARIVR